tara:strand:- start:1969 stop:2763 length:795 start_codon:yes stop_codon:yes gene_type:complete
MQKRHKNREQYFEEQAYTSKKYVLPLVNNLKSKKDLSILEIGCGEGGNLLPFYESKKYNRIVGIDMSLSKIENGKKFYSKKGNLNNIEFIHSDIYNIKPTEFGKFDVIITRDVLEHIHGHEKFLFFTKKLLKEDGIFFLGFPPWHNPFGGHQQMCKSKILSRLPFFHILPKKIYRTILKLFGESNIKILNLLEIKQTGITIEKFEKITRKTEYNILKRIFYFINPNYEIKFGLKPRISSKLISSVPYLRNFFITTNYYIISPKK